MHEGREKGVPPLEHLRDQVPEPQVWRYGPGRGKGQCIVRDLNEDVLLCGRGEEHYGAVQGEGAYNAGQFTGLTSLLRLPCSPALLSGGQQRPLFV